MNNSRKAHWDKIYATKTPGEVSWTQETPVTSLAFIHSFNLDPNASIIDVGGGESRLVDRLLEEGFDDVTVLDISERAIEHSKRRLGKSADQVTWVTSDILEFESNKKFDVWHDRATFHFLTTTEEIERYVEIVKGHIKANGFLVMSTFSEDGPTKCSGLEVKQYSETSLEEQLGHDFVKIRCLKEDHQTPFKTMQNFLFCAFRRSVD